MISLKGSFLLGVVVSTRNIRARLGCYRGIYCCRKLRVISPLHVGGALTFLKQAGALA